MSHLLLGANLIVRNEADDISRCLQSIRMIVDEIIVVDTGSDDGTADIARQFGATVISAEWEADFAKARNIALSHTSAEWVLVIDADEMVTEGAEQLRECLKQTKADALTVEIANPFGKQPWDFVTFHPVRLFRRGGKDHYRFQGRLHEQIVSMHGESIPASRIEPSPLKLFHDGYMPEKIKSRQKAQRNLNILAQMLKDSPNDPFTLYNLGVTYCQLGNPKEAAKFFAMAREHAPLAAAYRPTLIRDSAKALGQLGFWEEAAELLQVETGRYPDYADLHHLLGEALTHAGRLQEAREAYRKAAECPKKERAYVTEPGMGAFRAYYGLGNIARKLGATEEAKQWYEKCAAAQPLFEPGLLAWADALDLSGATSAEITERLMAAVKPANPDLMLFLAGIFVKIGLYPEALGLLKKTDTADPESKELLRECLMQTGQFKEALEMLDDEDSAAMLRENGGATADFALCFWSEDLPLPYRFYKRLSLEQQIAYEAADRFVMEGKRMPELEKAPAVRSLMADLMDRAVNRKLMRIADKLSQVSADCAVQLGISLYRHGFILPAADRLLVLMKEGRLSAEGLYILGEIVYDKGHYSQAAGLFEAVLSEYSAHHRARIGVSLCYLQLARELLADSLRKAPHHPAFHQDLKRVETSIALLEATDWHTAWSASERRNMHAAPEDLFVHDR
jgi:tetratricopeptide (TPR) repeat protein